MSLFKKRVDLNLLKRILRATLYKPGTISPILIGPLRGYKYRVNYLSGWAPLYNAYEPMSLKIYSRLVKKGDVVYDLGANTGVFTLAFSRFVAEAGKVFAFEPLPDNISELDFLIKLNGLKNVVAVKKAVSNFSGSSLFYLGDSSKEGSLQGIGHRSGNSLEVLVTTLDEAIRSGMPKPDFVKMDIEGDEGLALQGFSGMVKEAYPNFSIDLHLEEQDISIGNFLKQHGYKVYRLRDNFAVESNKQKDFLAEVPDLGKWWPDRDGLWGHIIALHPSRKVSKGNV